MGDSYWRFGDGRQTPVQAIPPVVGKRPRSDFDISGGHELSNNYPSRNDERLLHVIEDDVDTIGASYDRYLRNTKQLPLSSGRESGGPMNGGRVGHPADDPRVVGPGFGRMPEISLPRDASCTLYIEGLPANCTRREVAHIFRPFVGYKEVRIVSKEARHKEGDFILLSFVDFISPTYAAIAMDALQGYKFDESDRDSVSLRLQFARNPGARSGRGVHNGGRR